ncbi:MAG TPA: FIST N-terminal domain-containing protein, partial [Anaeromyxobacteraceae bacterium]|nr:FIST N-terminal domain-containing protein [Anaeromyxobacteraceae bacterium]
MAASNGLIEVGHAVRTDLPGYEAGFGAARQALGSIRLHAPSAAMVFASPRHDLDAVVRGVRAVVGDTLVFGASTSGEILNGIHEGAVVVTILASPHLSVRVGVGEEVARDWSAAVDQALSDPLINPFFDGSAVAWQRLNQEGKSAFAFMLSPGDTRRNDAKSFQILESLKRRSLGRLPIFGISAGDDMQMERVFVFANDRVVEDGLVVALFETQLRFGIAMAHGLQPGSGRLTATAVRDSEVLEFDQRPAADKYAELLGISPSALEGVHVTRSTGVVAGCPGPLGSFLTNVATYTTPTHGLRFAMPVAAGTVFELMRADAETCVAAAREVLNKAMARAQTTVPAVAFVGCCNLRPLLLGKAAEAEVPYMVAALGGAPLVGFFGYGEQGLADDGVPQHANFVIVALVLGDELSQMAQVARENEELRRKADTLLRREQEELERLVAARTVQLREEIDERRFAEAIAQRHHRALRTLSECNEALVRATQEQALFEAVCRILIEVGGYRLSWVGLVEHDEARTIRPVVRAGQDDGYVNSLRAVWAEGERGRGPSGAAVRSRQPVVVRDLVSAPDFAPWREAAVARGYASAAGLPLITEGEVFGVLTIYSGQVDAFDEDEIHLLAELAADLAFGVTALRGRAERTQMTAQLVQADRLVAMGTLAAGVAHEINNPLSYVLSGIDYMSEKLALGGANGLIGVEEIQEVIADARVGLGRIRQVVSELKMFSRGDQESRTVVEIVAVLEPSINMLRNELRHRARLVRNYKPTPRVQANEARLGQVFLNLILNAAQAIPEGAANENEISITTTTDERGRAMVEIRDSGTGILPADMERIFEPFYTT